MLNGDNGLLKRAGDARDDTVVGQEKEQVELAYVSAAVKKLGDEVDEEALRIELNSSVGNGKTTVSTNDDDTLNVYFTDTKHNYNVDGGIVLKVEKEEVPQGKVARIGTTYYESLQDAFDAVTANNTQTEVILLSDISENVHVIANQNIVLNLNNKIITNVEEIVSKEDEYGPYEATVPAVEIQSNATLQIKNGTIEASYGSVIVNYGTTTIISGTYTEKGEYNQTTIANGGGTLTITTGEFSSKTHTSVYSWGAASTYITGGSFTSDANSCIGCQSSYLKIEGGTFNCYFNGNALSVEGTNGNVDVYGGTFSGSGENHESYNSDFSDIKAYNPATINIYGGTYTTYEGNVIIH